MNTKRYTINWKLEKRKREKWYLQPQKRKSSTNHKILLQKSKEVQGKKKKNWPQMDFPILVVIWWLMGWKENNSKPIYKKIKSMGFKSKGKQLNVLREREAICLIRRWKVRERQRERERDWLLNLRKFGFNGNSLIV